MDEEPKPPEFFTKTGLQVEPIPTNEDLWAIGLVAYLWGIYEAHVHQYGMILTLHDKDARRAFVATNGLRQRTRKVRELIRIYAEPNSSTEWLDLVNRGASLQIQRDRIIHGNWAQNMGAEGKPIGRPFVHDAMEIKRKYKWAVDYNGIFATARQIDKLIVDCSDFQMAKWQPSDGGNLRASLLRRLRPPTHRPTHLARLLVSLRIYLKHLFQREP
jgi:hypothetical protein